MFISLVQVLLISLPFIELIKRNIVPSQFRLIILFLISGVVYLLMRLQNISLSDLGLNGNISGGVVAVYTLFTAGAFAVLLLLSKILKNKSATGWYKDPHFLFLFIPISIAQQFMF